MMCAIAIASRFEATNPSSTIVIAKSSQYVRYSSQQYPDPYPGEPVTHNNPDYMRDGGFFQARSGHAGHDRFNE